MAMTGVWLPSWAAPGHNLCWRMVMDGLRLTPVHPSFLDARDAIVRALDDIHSSGGLNAAEYNQVRRAAWEASRNTEWDRTPKVRGRVFL